MGAVCIYSSSDTEMRLSHLVAFLLFLVHAFAAPIREGVESDHHNDKKDMGKCNSDIELSRIIVEEGTSTTKTIEHNSVRKKRSPLLTPADKIRRLLFGFGVNKIGKAMILKGKKLFVW